VRTRGGNLRAAIGVLGVCGVVGGVELGLSTACVTRQSNGPCCVKSYMCNDKRSCQELLVRYV
jgi:hypothetical protein